METVTISKKRQRNEISGNPLRVVIIGSGVAGLAAAIALQNIPGISVQVYERDLKFNDRKQGYGMTLTNNPSGALAKLGVREECQAKNCTSSCHYIFDNIGHIIGYYGRYFDISSLKKVDNNDNMNQAFNLRIPRQDLRHMLYDKLSNSSTLHWGMKLVDYDESKENISIKFYNMILNQEEVIIADVLVGCDGIRSIVRELRDMKLYSNRDIPNPCPLSYLGISVIIGISSYEHPLITERGFYALDGKHRLFVMPFREPSTSSYDAHDEMKTSRLTMWQLSFSGLTEEEGLLLKSKSSEEILHDALHLVKGWFDPVSSIIQHTILGDIWMTPLYDRNPMQPTISNRDQISRVVVLGDACHPMSMFKGQGANQAMADGPLLAKWLSDDLNTLSYDGKKLSTRLKCFEREMLARTSSKVLGSRDAAHRLHQPAVFDDASKFGIEGVTKEHVDEVLKKLRMKNIDASRGESLDDSVLEVIRASS